MKDLIPLKVACKKLGISYKTLYSWVKNNEVSYTLIGNRYYLSSEQLNSLVFVYTKDYTQATK
ncbi:MAG TPA: helix-turn-helix domain-containing protein [Gallicola sp.]|nr:helix-turn-helix domain-containing protein [Gallicola sp.]